MEHIGVIGGTGLSELSDVVGHQAVKHETPFGLPSSEISTGAFQGTKVSFIARHGNPHSVPPHLINYRANIWALHELGVRSILSINAVGGITEGLNAGVLCIPHQIIDYTWGRDGTYFDGLFRPMKHIDFTHPYDETMRQNLLRVADSAGIQIIRQGVYGAVQGPRLETIAEIQRMENDGCDVVGMTGMPEAVLAQELGLSYTSISLVVNRAAGKFQGRITSEEIQRGLDLGVDNARQLLIHYLASLSK